MSSMLPWTVIGAVSGVIAVALLTGQPRVASLRMAPGPSQPLLRRLPMLPMAALGALGGAGLGWVFSGGAVALGVGAIAGATAAVWLVKRAQPDEKDRLRLAREFPLVLNFLASVVESGAPVRAAAAVVGEVCDDSSAARLKAVVARCEAGFTDSEAWRTLSDDPVWGDVARELARCVDSGVAVGDVLREAAAQATQAEAARAIAKARSVGVASTLPLVCCFLPAFLLVGVVPIVGGLIAGYVAGW